MAGRDKPWRLRVAAALLLLALVGGAMLWWEATGWRPERAAFPRQGILLGAADGLASVAMLRGAGAQFAYLEASAGTSGRDAQFARQMEALAGSGLPFGAVHRYDPCAPADRQAANFVTIVPRDPAMLPAAIALDAAGEGCPDPVREAAVESELTTFINQVENHTGQPVVLLLSPQFEERYGIAARIDRNLWLERDWRQPDYAGRPWTLWTANAHLRLERFAGPVRWLVVQP